VLRDVLGMTGTKFGCGRMRASTVHLDGVAIRSCITSIEHRRLAGHDEMRRRTNVP
jgi:aerobic-type carbon monoxide dehydrogenase small subunit (CoxS/CutS family)